MGTLRPPLPVKLFIGMLAGDPALFAACIGQLVGRYGPIDVQSRLLPWDHTDYYHREMGPGLLRQFIFFARLVDPGSLPEVKHAAQQLEQEYVRSGPSNRQRRINLDPGYVTEAKVVLATSKDFPHRIYIGREVYAESTLHFANRTRSFQAVGHTYPDYRSAETIALFNSAREMLRSELERQEGGSGGRSR